MARTGKSDPHFRHSVFVQLCCILYIPSPGQLLLLKWSKRKKSKSDKNHIPFVLAFQHYLDFEKIICVWLKILWLYGGLNGFLKTSFVKDAVKWSKVVETTKSGTFPILYKIQSMLLWLKLFIRIYKGSVTFSIMHSLKRTYNSTVKLILIDKYPEFNLL